MSEGTARAKSHPLSAIAAQREALTRDLETKKAFLKTLHHELKSATAADKNRLLWMIKTGTASVEQAQKNLGSFENPIVLPHLKLAGITLKFHPDYRAFDATVWVNNDGILPALGSFELDLSVSFYTYGQDPPLYDNAVYSKTTPDSTDVQPGGTNPFLYPNIPFVTKPGSPSALYTFDVLLFAGPDGVVADQNLHEQFQLQPPRIPRPIVSVVASIGT
jgi:hypothetical protein